jgi:hypothetical protein
MSDGSQNVKLADVINSARTMTEEQYIIKQSKKWQIVFVVGTGLLILFYFFCPYDNARNMYREHPVFTSILGLIFFGMFFYFLSECINRKPEITLTFKGIELRDTGRFEWNMIESFKILGYRTSMHYAEYLELQLKQSAKVEFEISWLNKNKDELIELILKYKGTSEVVYGGTEVRATHSQLYK